MTASVIVPTYNGGHKLPGILQALKDQTYQPGEIIVLVDGSTDNTKEVLEGWQQQLPIMKIIYQQNQGRSRVRNNGAKAAGSDLLLFFDDDMRPERTCIEIHVQHHSEHPGTILTGAQVDKEVKKGPDMQQFKAWLGKRWVKPLPKTKNVPLPKQNIFITAANFSISKDLLFTIGGFDERLTDAEDFDLAVRAYQKGVALYYDHSALAWHDDLITGKTYIRRQRQYRAAHEKLLKLKPELYAEGFVHEPMQPKGFKKLFFLFFAKKSWVNWLDSNSLKKIIPRIIRFKLYDWIITANGVFFIKKVEV